MSGAGLRRRLAAVAAALLLVPVAACSSDEASPGTATANPSLPAPMPDLELPGFGGAPAMDLRDIEGPTLVNVWATWCTPCRLEMPVLEEFQQTHGDTVDVLGINYQDPQQQAAEEFAAKAGVTYPSLRDVDGEISARSPFPLLRGLPFMALVVDGQMVASKFSRVETLQEAEELVEEFSPGLLDGSASAEPEQGNQQDVQQRAQPETQQDTQGQGRNRPADEEDE